MSRKYDIGEIVFVPAKITMIQEDENGVDYRLTIDTGDNELDEWFNEKNIAGDIVVGSIKEGNIFNPIPRWDPASFNNKSKEVNNAATGR